MTFEIADNRAAESSIPAATDVPAAPIRKTILTHLEFRRRFTLAERVAFDNFESGAWSPEQKAMLRTITEDMRLATAIDLDDPDTLAGVQFLEQIGLLAAGRAAEILA